jgi:hypothetical protein
MDLKFIEDKILAKLKELNDVNSQLVDSNKRLGALQEEQRAVYNRGLSVKGAIDELVKLKDEFLKVSKTAGLTLPVGVSPVANQPVAESTPPEAQVPAPAAVPQEVAQTPAKTPLEVI